MAEKVPGPEALPLPPRNGPMLEEAVFFDAYPERITEQYMNNFRFRIPGFRERHAAEDIDAVPSAPSALTAPHTSERFLHGTKRQFFEDIDAAIDAAIKAEEISGEKLKAAVEAEVNFRQPDAKPMSPEWVEAIVRSSELREAVEILLVPVYKRLRAMGYRHLDLVN